MSGKGKNAKSSGKRPAHNGAGPNGNGRRRKHGESGEDMGAGAEAGGNILEDFGFLLSPSLVAFCSAFTLGMLVCFWRPIIILPSLSSSTTKFLITRMW